MAKFNCNFISYTLTRAVDITVVIPSVTIPEAMAAGPGVLDAVSETDVNGDMEGMSAGISFPSHRKENKYPVLYLLHGMGNNHATWTGYTNIEMFAEERNIAVVMISAENKSYVNHKSGDRFYDFLETELPEFIGGMFPVSDRPEDTYIAGLSMGGFGTLVHGLKYPEKYAAIGAFSSAIFLEPSRLAGGLKEAVNPDYDPKTLALRLEKEGKKGIHIFIACGENDFLYDANKEFQQMLKEQGQEVTWVSTPGFGHEWRFWNMIVEQFLDWLPRSDAYKSVGKRQI
ncbi:S-formylglutathione hydrolase FrmB [Anaerocolumna jejuensis DSM 15929]|uniref:S-formylglutathione hydrolase FrmB n=1 Tax=Anaerocolumna jejuensis DSM 15929 TaxID=1121322 RepID=A0A1M6UCD4_9FIRM|nr:alpha/beta hydrolase family protein [Anaerocolumna jejuensis]SHK66837.1 S-formylglutathione hydrolase FrmB [Anaerocolumna jejuensis DSM 15929]